MTGLPGKRRLSPSLLAVLAILTLVVSCRTLPENPDPNIVDWLPESADIAVRLVVPGNNELASMLASCAGLDGDDVGKILERTALAVFGIELTEPALHAAAVGIWPRGVMSGVLGPQWSKSPEGRHRWIGPDGFEMAAVSREEILLSEGCLEEMLERKDKGTRMMAAVRSTEVVRGADLAAWVLEPEAFASAMPSIPLTDGNGNPLISSAVLALRRIDDGTYDLTLYAYTVEPRLARSLALVLRLALSAKLGTSADEAKRELLSRTEVEAGTGEVRLLLPGLSLNMIQDFMEDLTLFPEVGA